MRSSMSYHMKSLFQCMLYLNTCASKNPTFSDLIEPQMVSLCNYIANNINDLLPRHATSIKTLSYCCEVTPLLQKYIGEDSLKVEAHIIRILADKRVSCKTWTLTAPRLSSSTSSCAISSTGTFCPTRTWTRCSWTVLSRALPQILRATKRNRCSSVLIRS